MIVRGGRRQQEPLPAPHTDLLAVVFPLTMPREVLELLSTGDAMTNTSRRNFLRDVSFLSGSVLGMSGWRRGPWANGADAARLPSADMLVLGKDKRLIVHKSSPCEIETPAAILAEHPLTPARFLFVRNNQQPEGFVTLEPRADSDDWLIEFGGLVDGPRSIRVADLRMLPPVHHEIVLQCSGNGRKLFSQAAPCSGAPWEIGAVANVALGGVPLKTVIDHLKLKLDPRVRFVAAEGRDAPAESDGFDFEHSVPLGDALRFGFLANTLNGQPLPAVHGGPARLVMPGYYGTMHVKWVSRLRFEASETSNYHQVKRYRTPLEPIEPGTKYDFTLDNSEPNWRMKVKSIIFAPSDGAEVKSGRIGIRGVAFNDGRAKMDRVEVSLGGNSWRRADLKPSNGPFGWSTWTAPIDLPRGEHLVMCRAIDAWGRSQPMDGQIHWNPAGYTWNGVHRIRLRAT